MCEKILVLADVGGFLKPFGEWVAESLLVLAEAPLSALPADFEAWRKNRKGFLDGYVRSLLNAVLPHLDPEYRAKLKLSLDEAVQKVETELDAYKEAFEGYCAGRRAAGM